MADDPINAGLTAILQDPELADKHERARAALARRMPVGVGAPDPHAPAPPPPPHENTFGERMGEEWDRLKGMAEPAARAAGSFANRAIDKATFGGSTAAEDAIARGTGVRLGDTPEQRADFQQDHPWAAGTADAIGYVAPGGPAKVGEAIGRGVDALTGAVARRGAAKIAAKTLGGAATGAATAGVVRGAESLSRGDDPIHAGSEALDAAASPYSWGIGAGMGAGGGALGEGARAARESSPDLSILHKYGLEPGPIPGRPVIRQDSSIASQLPGMSEPPLGVSRATPATRGAAGRAAGDTIGADIDATEAANNTRFGELLKDVKTRTGKNPAELQPVFNEIDQQLSSLRLPPSTRSKLTDLREQLVQHSMPTRTGPYIRAEHLDDLRDLADTYARQEKTAEAKDVPLLQVGAKMRQSFEVAAPEWAKLNKTHSELMTGIDSRRALLGEPQNVGKGPYADETIGAQRAGRVQQEGEETGTAGRQQTRAGTRMERLAAMGPPEAHAGAAIPDHPDYSSTIAPARLQLAQENLQLTPSKLFSGAAPHALAVEAPTRLLYPLARRAGDASIAAKPVAADALIRALRGRKDKSMTNWQTDEQGGL